MIGPGASSPVLRPSRPSVTTPAGEFRAWANAGRRRALGDALGALALSRLLVWGAGIGGVQILGREPNWRGFDPTGLTVPFGSFGDLLAAPAARWDSVWYLNIAQHGYSGSGNAARSVFFPLYPLAVRILGAPFALIAGDEGAYPVAGVVVSLVSLAVGLYLVHRLAELELGASAARLTVVLLAFFPTAWAFSAVYSESMFLALSAGSLYAGRLGRWRWAGVLGALSAATRSTGVLLVVPLALMYLYGPRGDGDGDGDGEPERRGAQRWRPAYPLRPDVAWLAAIPLGLGAYLLYSGLLTGDAFSPMHAQKLWFHHFSPLGGLTDGARAAWAGVQQLASGSRSHVYFKPAGGDPFLVAQNNLRDFGFVVFALGALVGAARLLPLAYAAWAAVGMALPLSYPVGPEPLASVPRYLAVLFPLQMGLAAWTSGRHRRPDRALVLLYAGLLVVLTAQFAAWKWVA